MTIQVKTVRSPGPAAGHKGAPNAIGWWFPNDCKADLLALTLLDGDHVWLLPLEEARMLAWQHNIHDRRQIYWYTDSATAPGGARQQADMDEFRLEVRMVDFFPSRAEVQ